MQELIAKYIVELVVTIIGFFLIRSLKQVDKSILNLDETTKSLDKTTDDLKLDMQKRPNWSATKRMAQEVSDAAVKDHIIKNHSSAKSN